MYEITFIVCFKDIVAEAFKILMIFRSLIVCVRPSSRFLIKINWCRNLEIEVRFNSYPFLYRTTIFSWTEVANFCTWAFTLTASLVLLSFRLTVFYTVYNKFQSLYKFGWYSHCYLCLPCSNPRTKNKKGKVKKIHTSV